MEKHKIRNLGEGYFTRRPISIHVYREYSGWVSYFPEGDFESKGDNKKEAVDNIREVILVFYKNLSVERPQDLGPSLQKKKRILEDLVERIV